MNSILSMTGSDQIVNHFANFTFEQGCIPLITKPTRIGITSTTCIDIIIVNYVEPQLLAGILLEDISDHFLVFYHVPLKFKSNPMPNEKTFRDLSKHNIDKLIARIKDVDWKDVIGEPDPSCASNNLHTIISQSLDQTCPLT